MKALERYLRRLSQVCNHRNRQLHYDQYLLLYLLAFFNPVITSMRAIHRASDLPKVRKKLGLQGRASLGSLSEASHVFPAEELFTMIDQLSRKVLPTEPNRRLRQLTQTLTAVDGTVLPALPRMVWALWMDETHRGAKVHLQYEILKSVAVRAEVTEARANEVRTFHGTLQPGRLYVMDRGYADYGLFRDILKVKSSFVCRVRKNAVLRVAEKRPLSEADRRAGVQQDCIGKLGSNSNRPSPDQPMRIINVRIDKDGKETLLRLATDHLDLPADLVALIYQYRWSVELFFRWMKCTLRVRHLFSESSNGIQLQVYAALIATLILVLYTGIKPNKAIYELFCFYLQDWLSLDELLERLPKLKKQG